MTDEPLQRPRVDSLAAAAQAVQGRRFQRVLPYLVAALTGIAGWGAAKLDTQAEMGALRGSVEALGRQQRELVARIDSELLNRDERNPGRVVRIERGQYFAWRALSEIRAATYAGESVKKRALMDTLSAKFGAAFDKRASRDPPEIAYDEVFAKAAVE